MLGVVFALTRLRQYKFERHVTIITDHKPLESLNNKNLNMFHHDFNACCFAYRNMTLILSINLVLKYLDLTVFLGLSHFTRVTQQFLE